jgi:hypothetical protein
MNGRVYITYYVAYGSVSVEQSARAKEHSDARTLTIFMVYVLCWEQVLGHLQIGILMVVSVL